MKPEKSHRAEKNGRGLCIAKGEGCKGAPHILFWSQIALTVILVQRIDVSMVIRETKPTSTSSPMTLLETCRMGALVVREAASP